MLELIKLILGFKLKTLFIAKTNNSYIQFFRYFFVGGISTVVDWAALWFCYDVLDIFKYLSVAIGFCIGLVVNYVLSDKFVFNDVSKDKSTTQKFSIYLVTGLMGLGFTEIFMLIFDGLLNIHYMVSKVITTAIVFIWNFGSKKIALYRKRDKK